MYVYILHYLLVVRARSPDPNGNVSVPELFRVLLERRDDASKRSRDIREVGNSSSDDEDLNAPRLTRAVANGGHACNFKGLKTTTLDTVRMCGKQVHRDPARHGNKFET